MKTARVRKDLLAVRLPAGRSKLLLFGLFCAYGALAVRVAYLQGGWNTGFLQKQGEARYARTLSEAATRGSIYDRNGVVLASSVPARAIWANPADFEAGAHQRAELAHLLGMRVADLDRRVSENDRAFVYLRRQLDPGVAKEIAGLRIPGVHAAREYRRQYPEGPVTSQLLGFTSVDGRGQEGVEREYEGVLRGHSGLHHIIEDKLGNTIEDDWLHRPEQGGNISLAIDDRIQYIAHAAIAQAVQANAAKAAAAVVLDARTGELLALANWPDFDPAHRERMPPDAVRDRAVTDTFEPGSTMKPFSIATAIQDGIVRPATRIDTGNGTFRLGGHTIRDAERHDEILSVAQVLEKSSNVGTAKIALRMQARALWETLTAVGFGQVPHSHLPGAVAGRLRPPGAWHPVEQATIAYGYGVSVSLLQLAHAYLVFARHGDIIPVSVLRRDTPPMGVQVFRPDIVARMRRMLELVTSDQGTAPQARIPGYRVAGKTGTARKTRNGRYTRDYVASFVGLAPASDPRVVVAVMVDSPGNGHIYGGEVAAPAFATIAAGALRAMQVSPDEPTQAARNPAAHDRRGG